MHKTPKRVFEEIAKERPPCERAAILNDHFCAGRSTMEHVWTYAGRQIDEKWAIIRLCELAHSVGPYAMNGILNKEINRYLSLLHATVDDLKKYPRVDWVQLKRYLTQKYASSTNVCGHRQKRKALDERRDDLQRLPVEAEGR